MLTDGFGEWLRTAQVNRKRLDTLEMITAMHAHLAAGVTPLTGHIAFTTRDTTKPQRGNL
jgi:hypothetical protein